MGDMRGVTVTLRRGCRSNRPVILPCRTTKVPRPVEVRVRFKMGRWVLGSIPVGLPYSPKQEHTQRRSY